MTALRNENSAMQEVQPMLQRRLCLLYSYISLFVVPFLSLHELVTTITLMCTFNLHAVKLHLQFGLSHLFSFPNFHPPPLSGGCDFVTGQCECDEFRMGDSDLGDCGGYAIEASGWTGIER